jgi:hypothetical protein
LPGSDSLKGLKDTIRAFIYTDLFPQRTSSDIVSCGIRLFGTRWHFDKSTMGKKY